MIFQNCPKYHYNFEISRAGIIAKYHVQVMLLFVYNRSREIFGHAQETFILFRLKQQEWALTFATSFYVNEKMIDIYFVKAIE